MHKEFYMLLPSTDAWITSALVPHCQYHQTWSIREAMTRTSSCLIRAWVRPQWSWIMAPPWKACSSSPVGEYHLSRCLWRFHPPFSRDGPYAAQVAGLLAG